MTFRSRKTNTDKELPAVVEIGKTVGRRFGDIRVSTYASSIAFFFFLSFIPLLILAVRLVPFFGMSEQVVIRIVTRIAPDVTSDLLQDIARNIFFVSRRIVPVSLLILIWAASQGTVALLYGLNRVYDVEEHRNILQIYLISVIYTFAMLFLMIFLIFLIFGNAVSQYLNSLVPEIGVPGTPQTIWHSILFLVVGTFFFTVIYTFIPAGKRNPLEQIPGAFISALVWLIFSNIFKIYISGANRFTNFYGSVGTIAILLFWLYCCFYILLIGGFINRELARNGWLHRRKSAA